MGSVITASCAIAPSSRRSSTSSGATTTMCRASCRCCRVRLQSTDVPQGALMNKIDSAEARANGPLFLDDLEVGRRFTSGSHTVDVAQIKAFATQFDPQPFHLDEASARETMFRGLAASGWHTAAITMRLLVDGG